MEKLIITNGEESFWQETDPEFDTSDSENDIEVGMAHLRSIIDKKPDLLYKSHTAKFDEIKTLKETLMKLNSE